MDRLTSPSLAPGLIRPWPAELAWRIRRYLVLKIAGISAFTWVFFIGYFHLLRHPVHPVTIMPLTALDRLIPFQPQALAFYVSLWVYIGCAPGLLGTLRELVGYTLWVAALCLTGLACFLMWPTAVPECALDVTGHTGFVLLQGVDAAGNACPSLHVATAMFTALWVDYLLRHIHAPPAMRALNGGWFLAITYSTMAIKQHVAIDALAGILLGIPFALAALRWHQRHMTG